MGNVEIAIEGADLAEDNIPLALPQGPFHPLSTLEPEQLYAAGIIVEGGYQPALTTCPFLHDIDERSGDLGVFGGTVYCGNLYDLRAIEITIRIMVDQVFEGADSQLLTQQLAPLRAYTFEKLDR